jgi:hypothetical protein
MPKTKIEIARSYSQKVNLGNYTTADFFMSAKSEVDESEAEEKSKELYDLCRREVGGLAKSRRRMGNIK